MKDKELHSKKMRAQAVEADALRLGVGWSVRDLDKPWILVETAGGDSHPCAVHLGELASHVRDGVLEGGGAVGRYDCTDMCDGVAQGTSAMDYSLPTRELISFAVELHARSGYFDAAVLLCGGDKSQPGHLMAAARLDIPCIVLPGGVGDLGPSGVSLEQIGTLHSQKKMGQVSERDYRFYCETSCLSAGSCDFFGTSGTMQMISESLGLALPSSALRPQHLNLMKRGAREAGLQIMNLLRAGITTRDILTPKAFENAMIIFAAAGGSSNLLLHFPAIMRELDLPYSMEQVREIQNRIPVLLNIRPLGQYANHHFWYAGGVPALMKELREFLHLDALTVTGKTLGENLDHLEQQGYFTLWPRFLENFKISYRDVIRPVSDPLRNKGNIGILFGNIAQEGAVAKRETLSQNHSVFEGGAKVFWGQEKALEAIRAGKIQKGDCIVIAGEGPRGSGMPEMYYVTEAIATRPELNQGVALVTDGRFSGATRGPVVGHVSPEAYSGGAIALVQDGDRIRIDLEKEKIDIVSCKGNHEGKTVEEVLTERRKNMKLSPRKLEKGLLGIYRKLASSASAGGVMKLGNDE